MVDLHQGRGLSPLWNSIVAPVGLGQACLTGQRSRAYRLERRRQVAARMSLQCRSRCGRCQPTAALKVFAAGAAGRRDRLPDSEPRSWRPPAIRQGVRLLRAAATPGASRPSRPAMPGANAQYEAVRITSRAAGVPDAPALLARHLLLLSLTTPTHEGTVRSVPQDAPTHRGICVPAGNAYN